MDAVPDGRNRATGAADGGVSDELVFEQAPSPGYDVRMPISNKPMTYFSEREEGERPRENEEISERVWEGIFALVKARIVDGSFGNCHPKACNDGVGPVGTDKFAFGQAMLAEIPNLQKPPWELSVEQPRTLDILDIIEFCWRCVGKPLRLDYHKFFSHHHLKFDIKIGRDEFYKEINRIFRRNGLAYKLTGHGRIERLAPPLLREELASAKFRTGDDKLNGMLEKARRKFLGPDMAMRLEALEAIWDAWERLKTLGTGQDKKTQMKSLLDQTADSSSSQFRAKLEQEATKLTQIGNSFQIRHSETNQERLTNSQHVDYLFHRLFALIQVILRMNTQV